MALLRAPGEIVLVYSGCCKRTPWTGWLVNDIHVFLIVQKAGKFKIKVSADSGSGEGLLPVSMTTAFSVCPHKVEGTRESSGVSFIRTLILFVRAPPKGSTSQIPSPWG